MPLSQEDATKLMIDLFSVGGDMSRAGEVIADNAIDHQGIPGVDTNGLEGFKRVCAIYQGAFPDLKATLLSVATQGDRTFAHFHMTGTNTGAFMGMPATGKAIDIEGVDVMRFEGGKAVEHWGYVEEMKMMQQLGLMPAQG